VAEPYRHPIPVSTARASLPRLIFQFMARALQSTTTGLLNFAQMPEKRGWDPIRPG